MNISTNNKLVVSCVHNLASVYRSHQ